MENICERDCNQECWLDTSGDGGGGGGRCLETDASAETSMSAIFRLRILISLFVVWGIFFLFFKSLFHFRERKAEGTWNGPIS